MQDEVPKSSVPYSKSRSWTRGSLANIATRSRKYRGKEARNTLGNSNDRRCCRKLIGEMTAEIIFESLEFTARPTLRSRGNIVGLTPSSDDVGGRNTDILIWLRHAAPERPRAALPRIGKMVHLVLLLVECVPEGFSDVRIAFESGCSS